MRENRCRSHFSDMDARSDTTDGEKGHRRYYLRDLPLNEAGSRFDDALDRAGVGLLTASTLVERGGGTLYIGDRSPCGFAARAFWPRADVRARA